MKNNISTITTKYQPLYEYLFHCGKETLKLTFEEIEKILGFSLPLSAKKYRSIWANNDHNPLPNSWLSAGYETHSVDMKREIVPFRKITLTVQPDKPNERKKTTFLSVSNEGNVILLNKPFLGDWLDKQGNIGHEIIDFLQTDNGDYYVYNNPWGACPDNIWIDGTTNVKPCLQRLKKEKYVAKYMLLTSEEHENDFEILYVIELEEKLHRFHTTKSSDKTIFRNDQEKIKKLIRERNIIYNKKYLYAIYPDDDSLFLTFKGKAIYKAIEPIPVKGLTYNFQRNKGYVYDDKFPDDYKLLEDLIKNSLKNGILTPFAPRNVNKQQIGKLNANNTFLNLIGLQDNEQVFTNILHSLLEQSDLFKWFCNKFKGNKSFDDKEKFNIFRETKIVNGRMDICAESETQRIVIENKVYSSLNGIKPADNKTQLSTYYEWAKQKSSDALCFLIAPNFRISEIKREITKLDPAMVKVYCIRSYGEVADFFEEMYNTNKIPTSYIYYSLLPQIINAFKNLSYSTKEDLYARMFLDATK